MGKEEQFQNRHLINLLLDRQIQKQEATSLSDIDLEGLQQQQRTAKMMQSLNGWTAETNKIKN